MRHPMKKDEMEPKRGEPKAEWGRRHSEPLLERWPKTETGDPVPPVFLAHTIPNNLADEMMVNLLEAYGIPTMRRYPNDGEFGKVILGMSGGGVDIYVPETDLEAALDLLHGEVIEDDDQND